MPESRSHAVVVGCSIAGMLTARALSEFFERVTVLDRDAQPEARAHRPGVAQSRHLHLLLRAGQNVLESVFPCLEADLVAAGSVTIRVGYDVINVVPRGEWPRRDLGFTNHAQSRPLLEHCVRRRLSQVPNVELRWGCRVGGVLSDTGKQRVTGVSYHDDHGRHDLAADLVVDAAGRQARSLEWLSALGYTLPNETRIEVDIGYASTTFAIQPGRLPSRGVGITPDSGSSRRGALLEEIEGGRWWVSTGGRFGDYPPTDLAGFRSFLKSLTSPMIYDAIADLEPLEPIAGFRYPASIRRRFEKLDAFPEGLLVLGDALCTFNPVYGQGMSSAALQVDALRALMQKTIEEGRSFDGLWRAYFPVASNVVSTPWVQAGNADFAYPQTIGVRPANLEATQAYGRALTELAFEDPDVHKLVFEVMQLIRSRDAFRDPALIARIMPLVGRAESNAATSGA